MSTYTRPSTRSAGSLPAIISLSLLLAACGEAGVERTGNSLFHLDAPSATTHEDFDGVALTPGWTSWDGYALAQPGDLANHAQFGVSGSHLSISFPDGPEHNQWWLTHAQVTRPFEGSGVYTTKMDTGLGNEQFGLVFQSAPGTFLMFMLYGHDQLWGYVERFVTVGGQLYRTTLPGDGNDGYQTGFTVPDSGPYFLRVTVRDAAVPSNRYWNFQVSKDGESWGTVVSGALETGSSTGNIGTIQDVGVFAGNQPPYPFSGLDAEFDYYKVYPIELSGEAFDAQAELDWLAVNGAQGYRVYRSTVDGGPYSLVGTVTEPGFVDQGLTNGVPYYYVVTSYDAGPEVGYSLQTKLVPQHVPVPPDGLPVQGLALMLDATSLTGLTDLAPVEQWPDSSGNGNVATTSGSFAPTFLAAGVNGQPAVRFDGIDDYLQLPAGFEDFTDGLTIFLVARPTVLHAGFKLLALGNGAGVDNIVLGRAGTSGGLQYITTDDSGSYGWFNSSAGLVAGSASAFGVRQPAGAASSLVTGRLTVNGQEVGSGAVYVPPTESRNVNYIGRSYWADGAFQGELAEILIYDRELNAQERGVVQAYLDEKYDLSGTGPDPLQAPASVQAVVDGETIELSYGAVPGATEYLIARSGAAGGPYQELATTSGTSYVDSAVSVGTTYYYVVTASDGDQQSPPSAVVSATVPEDLPPNPDLPPGVPAQGLALFLNAGALSLPNGSAVTSWPDSSGQGNNAAGVSGPVFSATGLNGQPAVAFDGVNDHFTLPAGFDDFTAGMSLFVVAEPTALQPGFKLVALGNGGGIDNLVLGRAGDTPGLQYFTTNNSNTYGWFNTGAGLTTNDASVFGVYQPGGAANASVSAVVTVDGAAVGSGSVYVPRVGVRGVNYLGKSYWSEGYFQGRIAEVLLYERQLSASERAGVHGYLNDKYQLAGSEPDPLAAPASLQAAASFGSVELSYGAVTGATAYEIGRSGASSGPFQQIGTTNGTTYVDSQVTAGATYYYVVTATNGDLESAPSPAVSATVPANPPPNLPPELPAQGLALFLNAGTLNLSNGSSVSSWVDGSGQGNNAAAVAGPVYAASGINGQPAVMFDGVDDHFTLPTGFDDFSAGMSLFIVAEPTALPAGFKLFALGNAGGVDNVVLGRAGTTAGLQYFTTNNANTYGWFNTNQGLVANDATVFGVYQPGGAANSSVTAVVTVGGVSVGSGSVYVPTIAARSLNYIGKSYWSEGYFQGRIAEIVLYERQLSAGERSTVQGYLDAKYGL